MIRQIVPLFFTTDMDSTLAWHKDKLGFECEGSWGDRTTYAIVARDQQAIHFRFAAPPTANPDKYEDELLDAYLNVEDADTLHAENAAKGVEFTRKFADTSWRSREFMVKDCDGQLLAFGLILWGGSVGGVINTDGAGEWRQVDSWDELVPVRSSRLSRVVFYRDRTFLHPNSSLKYASEGASTARPDPPRSSRPSRRPGSPGAAPP